MQVNAQPIASSPAREDRALAKAFGFHVEHGDASHGKCLAGKWWWSLSQAGWSGVETSPGEFATEDEAWADAVRAHRVELAAA